MSITLFFFDQLYAMIWLGGAIYENDYNEINEIYTYIGILSV